MSKECPMCAKTNGGLCRLHQSQIPDEKGRECQIELNDAETAAANDVGPLQRRFKEEADKWF